MKYAHVILASLIIGLAGSCTKDEPVYPEPPIVVRFDTLGTGWSKIMVDSPASGGLTDIYFKDNLTGYTSSFGSNYKTTDGGVTWQKNALPGFTNIAVTGNGNIFGVATFRDSIYKSTDNGLSGQGYKIAVNGYKDINFVDNNTGICTTPGGVFGTSDGGANWSEITPSVLNFFGNGISSAYMQSSTNAWVVHQNGVLRSNGSLSAWALDTVSIPASMYLTAVFATSASVVYVAANTGELYKSTDGGASFLFLRKLDNIVLNASTFSDIHFTDASTGYVSVSSRIYKTTDAGASWSVVVALGNTNIVEIYFSDASHGWACCSDGSVLKFN